MDKSSEKQFSLAAISSGILSRGNYLWVNCPEAIIQGQSSSEQFSGGGDNLPRGLLCGGQSSGGQFSSGAIVWTPPGLCVRLDEILLSMLINEHCFTKKS